MRCLKRLKRGKSYPASGSAMMPVKALLRGGSDGEEPRRNRDLERRGEDAEDLIEDFLAGGISESRLVCSSK